MKKTMGVVIAGIVMGLVMLVPARVHAVCGDAPAVSPAAPIPCKEAADPTSLCAYKFNQAVDLGEILYKR